MQKLSNYCDYIALKNNLKCMAASKFHKKEFLQKNNYKDWKRKIIFFVSFSKAPEERK